MENLTEDDIIECIKKLTHNGHKLKRERSVFDYGALGTFKRYRIGNLLICFYYPIYLESPFDEFKVSCYFQDKEIYSERFGHCSLSKVHYFVSEYEKGLEKERLLKEEEKKQSTIKKFLNIIRKCNNN